jgi:hypothetical protein
MKIGAPRRPAGGFTYVFPGDLFAPTAESAASNQTTIVRMICAANPLGVTPVLSAPARYTPAAGPNIIMLATASPSPSIPAKTRKSAEVAARRR